MGKGRREERQQERGDNREVEVVSIINIEQTLLVIFLLCTLDSVVGKMAVSANTTSRSRLLKAPQSLVPAWEPGRLGVALTKPHIQPSQPWQQNAPLRTACSCPPLAPFQNESPKPGRRNLVKLPAQSHDTAACTTTAIRVVARFGPPLLGHDTTLNEQHPQPAGSKWCSRGALGLFDTHLPSLHVGRGFPNVQA